MEKTVGKKSIMNPKKTLMKDEKRESKKQRKFFLRKKR
jgi:hypothetical protein